MRSHHTAPHRTAYGPGPLAPGSGRDGEHGVDLVGTVPASLAAFLALQAWPSADLVISTGTAGGFKAKVGERGRGAHA